MTPPPDAGTNGAPPRLLHVFSTFATGGPQVRFAAIANHFGPRYRHLLVAMDGNLACRERLDPTLDVVFPAIPTPKGRTLANARAFRRALADLRPDALVTSNWGTIEWALANMLPLTRHIHIEDGFGPEEQDRQLPRRVLMRRLALRRATVVLPSRTLWRIATEIWRLPERRLRYVPNGIDLARFAAPMPDPEPQSIPGALVIGTVAALRREKNLGRLLHAFARVIAERPARLVIVGDGPERAGLEQLAGTLGISERVFFAGHVARPDALLRSFDVFALSSDTEQMPLSVLEAMAAGLPVVATDVGDVRAVLAPENDGFVVSCEEGALADALAALLAAPPERRAAIGEANRAKAAREFDQARMFDAYAALFEGIA
jgi:glycosyltransferase involved in cell wall biosynthesis